MILKSKQVLCLEAVFQGKDLLAVLPTGYDKSTIFHLLPSLLAERKIRFGLLEKTVVIVISLLNALIHGHLKHLLQLGIYNNLNC